MPPVYENMGGIMVKSNALQEDRAADRRLCGNRRCRMCIEWFIDSLIRRDSINFRFTNPECWRCHAFFRKGV